MTPARPSPAARETEQNTHATTAGRRGDENAVECLRHSNEKVQR